MIKGGPLMPSPTADPLTEYRAARAAAAFSDRTADGKIEAAGADRVRFLHGLLSNDVRKLSPNQACLAALLDNKAHVQSLVTVVAKEDRLLLRTPPGGAAKVLALLNRYLISEDVSLRDATSEWSIFQLVGPDAERHVPSDAVRTDELGAPTFEVWCASDSAAAARGRLKAVELGAAAFESLRLEAGAPMLGRDVDESNLLPEMGLENRVSYDKGCYLGQETVARVKYRGHVNRQLAGLVFESDEPPAPDSAVMSEGQEIGRTRSAAWSFAFDRPIALAYLKREALEPGLDVTVEAAGSGKKLAAQVSALPFPLPGR
jgi:folate-binding protein YgfZ